MRIELEQQSRYHLTRRISNLIVYRLWRQLGTQINRQFSNQPENYLWEKLYKGLENTLP